MSDEVAEEYAEHVESLPPVILWDVDGRYLLGDGWHRHRAHELAGKTDIRVQILKGTLEQAKLYVANCDARVGLRRNRAAKRAAVLLVLATAAGAEWSDRKIGGHCGVSHTFVGLVRARLAAGTGEEDAVVGGNVATPRGCDEGRSDSSSGNVATTGGARGANEGAEVGNVADREGAATTRSRRSKGGKVATTEEPEREPTESEDHTPDDDTEELCDVGAALPAYGESTVPTVNDVIDSADALLAACESDGERREALAQLLEALSGMLSALGEVEELADGDLFDDVV